MLAGFHRHAERSREIDAQGEAGAVWQRWQDNLVELECYAQQQVSGISAESVFRVRHLAGQFAAGRAALFARRIEEGRIVDGHGDLLADDIFWVDGRPALLDCLEFDDKLRYVDCADDAAFLAMDLEFLGRRDLGDYFLERYAFHAADTAPAPLRDFYVAYRAGVRAKVDCVRVSQGRPEAADDAARHLAIATRHLESGTVRLALVGGNPGTGKSTIARMLAERFGAQVISTDDVRRELRDSGVIGGDAGVLDDGLYSPGNVATVYDVVLRRANLLLAQGHSVVLDGTWRDPSARAQARRLAAEAHSRDGRAPVFHDGRHGRRPDHDEAARQLRGDPGDRRGHGGAAGGLADRAPARHHNNARSAVGRGRRRLAARVVGAGVGGRGKVSAAADTSAEKGRRTARAPEDQRL